MLDVNILGRIMSDQSVHFVEDLDDQPDYTEPADAANTSDKWTEEGI